MIAAFFAFSSGASAQVAGPSLLVQLQTAGVASAINAGAQNVVLANVRLDATASTDDIRLASLPIVLTSGNGGTATSLTSCHAVNSVTPSNNLNSGTNAIANLSSGANSIVFDSPMIIARGTALNLLIECNIASNLPAGGTYQFSINTASVPATAVSTGLPAVVGVGGVAVTPVPVPVPGIPNTGFGGAATTNIALLIGSIAVAGLGLAYTRKYAR
ncbi:MAG: hypothetical protein JWN89_51 [Parcubacteria group bacterium]|nr:hypothetical protein [Parcubacteria group bacterium]